MACRYILGGDVNWRGDVGWVRLGPYVNWPELHETTFISSLIAINEIFIVILSWKARKKISLNFQFASHSWALNETDCD